MLIGLVLLSLVLRGYCAKVYISFTQKYVTYCKNRTDSMVSDAGFQLATSET